MRRNALDTKFLGHPKPLFSLSMTELWERFSFYGIRPLLVLFMTAAITSGGFGLSRESAAAIAGIFGGSLYLAALPGGWIADNFLGQRKAVVIGSLIIASGHLSIALSYFAPPFFFLGLTLIVIGTGLFKTCASVLVGTLYERGDSRRDSGFTIFYMGINLGGLCAPLVTGFLQVNYGWHYGFGAGGIGMLIAIAIFQLFTIPNFREFQEQVGIDAIWDRPTHENKKAKWIVLAGALVVFGAIVLCLGGFIELNPVAIASKMIIVILGSAGVYFIYLFFFSSLDSDEKKNLMVFVVLFLSAALFWSVFEQQYTTFNFFADSLTNRHAFGFEIPAVWFQSVNAFFIIILAPVMSYLWIFLARRKCELTSISKFALGLVGAGLGFVVMAWAASSVIAANGDALSAMEAIKEGRGVLASPWWLVVSLLLLSLGELCLSPVGLSIMTKLAPKLIKSQVMGLWFLAGSLGNVIAGLIGGEAHGGHLATLPDLFYKCVWILFIVAAVLFVLRPFINKLTKTSAQSAESKEVL